MIEIGAISLPPQQANGAWMGDDGNLLLWTQGAGSLLFSPSENVSLSTIDLPPDVVVVGTAVTQEHPLQVQVFSAHPASLWTIEQGQMSRMLALPLLDRFIMGSAVLHKGSWYFTAVADDTVNVGRVGIDGEVTLLETSSISSPTVPILSTAQAGIIITQPVSPFLSWLVDVEGRISHAIAPLAMPEISSAIAEPPPGNWVSLPFVDFGQEFLQTITDLRGDRRLIIVYTANLTPIRVVKFTIPIGFAAASKKKRQIVGLRGGTTREIIIYTWKWTDEDRRPDPTTNNSGG